MAKNTPTTLTGKRLVQVLRVSRVNGRKGSSFMSPEQQEEACERVCDREGAVIVARIDETDSVSGGSVEREGLQEALRLCDDGEADGIVVAKMDRFARTALGGLTLIVDMEKKGHLLISAQEGVMVGDSSITMTATDKLMRSLWLMLAQWVRDTLTESWAATVERNIANGVAGHPPYGYMKDENKRLVPDPDEADFVRQMFDLRIQGLGWVAITKTMNEAGAKPRRAAKFTHPRISAIVENRAYLGELRSGENVNESAHEPLVSRAVFDAANATRSLKPRAEAQTSLLAGLVRCASCGQKMRSETRRHLRYYRCRRHHSWGDCPDPVMVPAEPLDALLEARFWADGNDIGAEATQDNVALMEAQERYDSAEADLHNYITTVDSRRRGYLDGLDAKERAVETAQEALSAAQTAVRGHYRPASLAEDWEEMTNEDKRSFLVAAFEMAAVRPVRTWREDIAARTLIWGRGEIGAPTVPLALSPIPFPQDSPPGAGVAAA